MNSSWIDDAIIYNIYPLGFAGAPKQNDGIRTSRILQIYQWIEHIKDLGCNTILFNPIFQSSTHGYDTIDYYDTDARLGSKEDFKNLFNELHTKNIKIILDGVFNHVGRDFWAFKDVKEKKWDSIYKDWFANIDFSKQSSLGDPFSYGMWEGHPELVKLNLYSNDVCSHLLNAVKMWIREFDIDGLRIDAANCIDKEFIKKLKITCRELKKDFWLMGELIHGDYNMWMGNDLLDSITNYECWKGIYSSHNDMNYFEINYALNRQKGQYGIYRDKLLYNFLDNHDVSRIMTLLKDKRNIYNVYTLLFTMPGIPSIYYGSEFGLEAEKFKGAGGDDAIRPQLALNELKNTSMQLQQHIKMLSKLKHENQSLKNGNYREIIIKNKQWVFTREAENNHIVVCFNCADESATLDFNVYGTEHHVLLEPHSSQIFN